MEEKGKEAMMDEVRAVYGDLLPEQEFLIERDWEWFRRRHELYAYRFSREGALPKKMKEIILAVATAVRMPGSEAARYIKAHMRHAIELGATPEEILEAFECITFPAGGSTMMVGVKCLRDLLAEGEAGRPGRGGGRAGGARAAAHPPAREGEKGPLERRALEERQLEVHGYVLPEHKFIMDRDWEWTLRSHELYDYTFTREGALPPKMRSIVVVVALCARIPGVEGERYIKNHMRLALKAGAREEEIFEALQCANFPCGGPTMLVGMKCLRAVLEERGAPRSP